MHGKIKAMFSDSPILLVYATICNSMLVYQDTSHLNKRTLLEIHILWKFHHLNDQNMHCAGVSRMKQRLLAISLIVK